MRIPQIPDRSLPPEPEMQGIEDEWPEEEYEIEDEWPEEGEEK